MVKTLLQQIRLLYSRQCGVVCSVHYIMYCVCVYVAVCTIMYVVVYLEIWGGESLYQFIPGGGIAQAIDMASCEYETSP